VRVGFLAAISVGQTGEQMAPLGELADYRVARPEDVVSIGDEIMVRVIEVDPQGRVNLSRRAVLEGPSARPAPQPAGGFAPAGGRGPSSGGFRGPPGGRGPVGQGGPGGFRAPVDPPRSGPPAERRPLADGEEGRDPNRRPLGPKRW